MGGDIYVTGTTVWYQWNTTSNAVTTGGTDAWVYWNRGTATTDVVWQEWTSNATTASDSTYYCTPAAPMQSYLTVAEQAELLKAQKERERVYKEEQAEAEKKRKAAHARAEKLFLDALTQQQREQYQKLKAFDVVASNGKQYRVKAAGIHGNIEELGEDGKVAATLCVAPKMECGNHPPDPDAWLAQKLWLEHDLPGLLKVANRTRRAA